MHLVQELLELFNLEDVDQLVESAAGNEQFFFAISQDAVQGILGSRTMKLQGTIQGHDLVILVDSGSSSTFLSQSVASRLSGVQPLLSKVYVQVSNGNVLQCLNWLPQAHWSIGEFHFTSDLRILPLHHFDMILGMDWLEAFSPMKIHWQQKWLALPYNGSTTFIQGDPQPLTDDIVVHLCCLVDSSHTAVCAQYPALASLLEEFDFLFAPLSALPPQRNCHHVIPLVPSAKPVHVRPFRYTPTLNDEIEKQVADMLTQGIIQPSTKCIFFSHSASQEKKMGPGGFVWITGI